MLASVFVLLGLLQVCASFEWGTTFGGLAPCYNIRYDCKYNGYPTCCGLLDPTEEGAKSSSSQLKSPKVEGTATTDVCTITKEYLPSPYEEKQLAKAEELHKIPDANKRKADLIEYIRQDIPDSKAWLARVKTHMDSEKVPEAGKDDLEYLSRFQITKTCTGAYSHMSSSWVEWIEPLTVHARHPFAMRECRDAVFTPEQKEEFKGVGLQSLDYLIIKSGHELHEATSLTRHNHTKFVAHRNQNTVHRADHIQSRNFMLDAGTSTFQSSLVWFLCAYLQRKVAFDQDYGYEYTLLEPQDFWKRVPNRVKPIYHFFNAPISAGPDDDMSPLRFIKEIANEDDFVAFKLDVDTPTVEIPQAMAILQNPEVSKLVDEFFFELHFRCEILMYCGWGTSMPEEYAGLKLDRLHAMQFFQNLRKLGIRAHFWP